MCLLFPAGCDMHALSVSHEFVSSINCDFHLFHRSFLHVVLWDALFCHFLICRITVRKQARIFLFFNLHQHSINPRLTPPDGSHDQHREHGETRKRHRQLPLRSCPLPREKPQGQVCRPVVGAHRYALLILRK